MISRFQNPLAEGLVYEDSLPLTWKELDQPLGEGILSHLNESNESFLKIFTALEDHYPMYQEDGDVYADLHQDIKRVDLKLTLLLDLVGHVLNRQLQIPESVPIRIGAQGIEWQAKQIPSEGSNINVELFLYPRYPRPIELPGNVVSAKQDDNEGRAIVAFQGISESVQDGIEKIIFRYHRRSIANRRMANK